MSYSSCGCDTTWVAPTVPNIVNTCSGSQYVAFMSIVDVIIRYACVLADPCNRITPKTQPRPEYDFIVIGSGSGGSTIAGRLAEVAEFNTLLLEAGFDEPPATQIPAVPAFINTQIDWNFTTQQETGACLSQNGYCTWPRGKVLGGTSVFNGMMYIRGTQHDYHRWAEVFNYTDWGYDDLLPVFKASEGNRQVGSLVSAKYHGTDGPFTIQQFNYQPELAKDLLVAARQTGWPVSDDLNGEQHFGIAIAQTNTRHGARLSLAKAYVRSHRNNANFDVMLNSTVTKILISGEGDEKRATGVQFVYNGQTYTVNATKEVILAAGAVQTPQILLLSGIGPKEGIEKFGIKQLHNLPGVGKGIKNHVSFALGGTVDELSVSDMNFETLQEYLDHENGPLSSTGITQVTARLSSRFNPDDDPDIQLFFGGFSNTCSSSGDPDVPADINNPNAKRPVSIFCVNVQPRSSGSISLLSDNPFDPPKIQANYLSDPHDIKVIIEAIRIAQNFSRAPILREKYNFTLTRSAHGNCLTLHEYDSDEYWECSIRYSTYPENHQASSCKLGPASDPETCVNQRLQVHGIPNLRITDASVMVDLPSGNTQATVVAIAERASQFIKEDYLGA